MFCSCLPLIYASYYDESVKVSNILNGRNIDPLAIPVAPGVSVLEVEVNFIISSLVYVDIAHEKIKFTAALFLRWHDYNLAWDLKDANASSLMRPAKDMWYPQLLLTTSVNELTMIRPDPRFDLIHVTNTVSFEFVTISRRNYSNLL